MRSIRQEGPRRHVINLPLRFPDHAMPTPRESQVLNQLLRGLSQVDVAAQEGIALSTVRMHVRNLHQKTGTRNLHSLVIWAVEHRQCCLGGA